jgi:hypothetical protein
MQSTETVERTALKEWAVLIDAMVRGEFCAIIRKGGIREQRAGFAVRHDRFLLYPTYFHEKADELAPALRDRLADIHERRPQAGTVNLGHCAHVRAVWRVSELDLLRKLDGEHGLHWNAIESRFHYRNNPGVHVIAVQLMSLPQSVSIPETRRYQGCVSWVELDNDVSLEGAALVRPAAETETHVQRLRSILGSPLKEEVR